VPAGHFDPRLASRPGRIVTSGCVRLNACICVFSSTLTTSALGPVYAEAEEPALGLALLGVSPLAGDKLPMPAQQRVRRDDRRKLAQRLTAQSIGPRGKFPPVVIGEPEAPPTDLLPQDPILFDQVRQYLPLSPVQPAGDREQ